MVGFAKSTMAQQGEKETKQDSSFRVCKDEFDSFNSRDNGTMILHLERRHETAA